MKILESLRKIKRKENIREKRKKKKVKEGER